MWVSKEPFAVRATPCPGCGKCVSNHDDRFKFKAGPNQGKYAQGYGDPVDLMRRTKVELCECHDCQVLHGLKTDHSEALRALARKQRKRRQFLRPLGKLGKRRQRKRITVVEA